MRSLMRYSDPVSFFFFNDTATTEIYTLSLHDALPISGIEIVLVVTIVNNVNNDQVGAIVKFAMENPKKIANFTIDRKSTRLNSSHGYISYAVFCLKKKTKTNLRRSTPR